MDVTIIIASSSIYEKEGTMDSNPTLFLLQFHRLMKKSLPDKSVEEMFRLIGSVCGKLGFKVRRTGGSSGRTNAQTDVDFLHGMHFFRSAIPRRLGGCTIGREKCHYTVTYRKQHTSQHDLSHVSTVIYSPIRRGGSFYMQPGMMDKYPCLGEFAYVKMVAVMIIDALNKRD